MRTVDLARVEATDGPRIVAEAGQENTMAGHDYAQNPITAMSSRI